MGAATEAVQLLEKYLQKRKVAKINEAITSMYDYSANWRLASLIGQYKAPRKVEH